MNAPCYNGVKERKLEFEEEIKTGTESQRHTLKKQRKENNESKIKRKKMTLVSAKDPSAGQGKTFVFRLFFRNDMRNASTRPRVSDEAPGKRCLNLANRETFPCGDIHLFPPRLRD